MNTLVPSQDDTLCVQLRDLVKPLGHRDHLQAYNKFKTFAKLLSSSPTQNVLPFKSDIYTDSITWRIVDTFVMTRLCAAAFASFVDPMRGIEMLTQIVNAQPEPAPIPYFHAKTCNKRMLAERYNRSISSITRTFERNAEWLEEIGGMDAHIEDRDGELWFTEAYASCIAFGGGKVAAQTKAKAMLAMQDAKALPNTTTELLN